MKKNFDNKKKYLSLHHSKITDISNDGDLVAQLVEQYTFNVWVLGSNPSQVTKKTISLRGEIGRHAILRGWYPKDVLVRIQSQTPIKIFVHSYCRPGSSAGRAIHF